MTKAEIVTQIAHKTGLNLDTAEKALDSYHAIIAGQLTKGNRVRMRGIGSLIAAPTPEKHFARNPRTGELLPPIPAGRRIKFTAASAFKLELAQTLPIAAE